jgi:hypothetical protein
MDQQVGELALRAAMPWLGELGVELGFRTFHSNQRFPSLAPTHLMLPFCFLIRFKLRLRLL